MSRRCSICRHPKLDMINVSLLRDGTRSTVREFQISRSALDRHKRHLTESVKFQVERGAIHRVGPTPAEPLNEPQEDPVLAQLEVMIRRSENTMSQAVTDKDFRIVIRAMREQRAQLELKSRIVSEQRRNRLFAVRADQESPSSEASPAEDIYEQLALVTLRLRIKLASKELGERVSIEQPSNLKYLRQKYAGLRSRLEQRELLSLSRGLAVIRT
jgi:hypothetical protein